MRQKKKLDLDALSVDSFQTSGGGDARGGTVHGHEIEPTPPEYQAPCTCAYSCLCKTAYYHCGTGYYTIYSCDYTANGSCLVTQ